jgi:hypothetical protein
MFNSQCKSASLHEKNIQSMMNTKKHKRSQLNKMTGEQKISALLQRFIKHCQKLFRPLSDTFAKLCLYSNIIFMIKIATQDIFSLSQVYLSNLRIRC